MNKYYLILNNKLITNVLNKFEIRGLKSISVLGGGISRTL